MNAAGATIEWLTNKATGTIAGGAGGSGALRGGAGGAGVSNNARTFGGGAIATTIGTLRNSG